jgi:hypothetical protein
MKRGIIGWVKNRIVNHEKRSEERFFANMKRKANAREANQRRVREQYMRQKANAVAKNNTKRRLNTFKANLKLRSGETLLNRQMRLSHTTVPFNRGTNQYFNAISALKNAIRNSRQPRYNTSRVLHI